MSDILYSVDLSDIKSASNLEVKRKADKVVGATAGDLASLDYEGNLIDSTYKPEDFALGENTDLNARVDDISDVDFE